MAKPPDDKLGPYRRRRHAGKTPEPQVGPDEPAAPEAKATPKTAKRLKAPKAAKPAKASRAANAAKTAGHASQPRPARAPKGRPEPRQEQRVFVVQKHDATTLHYDVRLEVDAVLKSWAVPKGPSLDPRMRRLAMPTEDHPMEYATFEGNIPQGEYGAGPVIVWDAGVYRNLKADSAGREIPMATCLEQGRVEVYLTGRKLVGGFALVRTGTDPGGRNRWLMLKMRDQHADSHLDLTVERPESVLSGRTIEQVARQR